MTATQVYDDSVQLPDDRPLMARDAEVKKFIITRILSELPIIGNDRHLLIEHIRYLEKRNLWLERQLSPEVDADSARSRNRGG